eukprot:m51a1_g12068 hypothetical protein (168) ;mRNA; r:330-2984
MTPETPVQLDEGDVEALCRSLHMCSDCEVRQLLTDPAQYDTRTLRCALLALKRRRERELSDSAAEFRKLDPLGASSEAEAEGGMFTCYFHVDEASAQRVQRGSAAIQVFLEYCRQQGVWECPVCSKPCLLKDLYEDEDMKAVVCRAPGSAVFAYINPSGNLLLKLLL